MTVWQQLWADEAGAVLTAEAVMVGSVAVIGSVVGLSAASSAVNAEMTEMASAIRSLDQSYLIQGRKSCGAWTAGSYYIQPRVEQSLQELCGEGELDVVRAREEIDAERDRIYPVITEELPRNQLPPAGKPHLEPANRPEGKHPDMKRPERDRQDAESLRSSKAVENKTMEKSRKDDDDKPRRPESKRPESSRRESNRPLKSSERQIDNDNP